MKNLLGPLLYYSAAILSIYITYALSQGLTPNLPAAFGSEPVGAALKLWLFTNSLVAAGFLSFGLSERLCQSPLKKFLPLPVAAMGAVAAFAAPSASGAALLPWLALLLLPVGYLASGAHYVLAMKVESRLSGRLLGLAITLTVLVQYMLAADGKAVPSMQVALVFALTGALSCFCLQNLPPSPEKDEENEELSPPHAPQYFGLLFLLVALLATLHGCGDSIALTFYSQVDDSLFHASSRLFLPVGLLLAGAVADWRDRHFLLCITAVGLLLRIISFSLLNTRDGFFFSQSVEYIIAAFLIMCYTLYFLDLAPRTSRPALWAGMGRTIALPVSALSANIFYFAGSYSGGFVSVYILVLALLNIFFYHNKFREWLEIPIRGELQPAASCALPSNTIISPPDTSALPTLADWQEKFSFTPREMEVLEEVLTEKTAAEIAEELGIKERTVRYHIANLLKKTGTTHRAELKLLLSLPMDVRE